MGNLRIILVVLSLSTGASALAQGKIEATQIDGTMVDIYTPPNYNTQKKYPVIYFNDGQMLFGHESLTMAFQVILDSMISNQLIEDVIVVGIFADQYRAEKYVPYPDSRSEFLPDGTSYFEYYTNYILNKVIPYVEDNYSTIQNANGRAMFGFSFGGLNALWMLFNHPETFSMAAGISPSLWVNDFAMFDETKKYQPDQKVWYDLGTGEWNYYVPFQKHLKDNGAKINENAYYYEVVGAVHNWQAVKERVHLPLLVFAGTKPHEPKSMEVEIEVIPSQSSPGKKFTRLNPIVNCKSGLKYSLAYEANYEVLNPEAGKVYEEGRFELFGKDNLEVMVSYKDFCKKVKIRSKLLD